MVNGEEALRGLFGSLTGLIDNPFYLEHLLNPTALAPPRRENLFEDAASSARGDVFREGIKDESPKW